VENIFDFANIPQSCDIIETNLANIFLEKLPNLVNVWKDDIGEILKYNNLRRISVLSSPKLKYLFPVSVANDLEKLEFLDIRFCWTMKEIVAWDKHSSENAINFKFPHLNTLLLIRLNYLRSFYSGTHTLEWPQLKELTIVDCSMLEGLTSEIINSRVQPIVLATKKVQSLFRYKSQKFFSELFYRKYIEYALFRRKLELAMPDKDVRLCISFLEPK